jgi:hypothetical protein
MKFHVIKSDPENAESMRRVFLQSHPFQFVHNKCHSAGWSDIYLFMHSGEPIGYGSVWGKDIRDNPDTIFEFYLKAPFRKYATNIFPEFIKISGVAFIECQTNDYLLAQMFFGHAKNIRAEAILFEDHFETHIIVEGVRFAKHQVPSGDTEYQLELHDEVVATGGFVWNYNFPYIDLYYEVKEAHRNKGFGSLIVQELKKETYRQGHVPAARCNIDNIASQRTLIGGGMRICGHMLTGEI